MIEQNLIPGTLWSQEEKSIFKNYVEAVEGLAVKFHDHQFMISKGETHQALGKKREYSNARTSATFVELRKEFISAFESIEDRLAQSTRVREKAAFELIVKYSHEAEPRQALGDLKKIIALCDNQTTLK